jgi:hypothetical protein
MKKCNKKSSIMERQHIINELKRNNDIFRDLLLNLHGDIIYWKQNPEKWCLLEIVCHLCDEEMEDFRPRVKSILENPDLPLNPINPVGWVVERNYIKQDYEKMLNNFFNERIKSLEWLSELNSQSWDNVHKHPKFGDISTKMIFTNWLAHDYLHIRQIIRLKYDYLKSVTGENLSYAGDW